MTVYVDDMKAKLQRGFRTYIMSHMIADTEKELHRMANKIGVDRKYYQGDHYDICQSKRVLAVHHGAKSVTQRELAKIVIAKRKKALDAVLKEEVR